ncbi:MAG: methionine--tRNA ligase [bacterium]
MATIKTGKRILATSALPYANGPIHLGHLAGAYLPADIFVRYCRLKQRDVVYICGSDENGVPIMLRARDEGKDPQEIVDRYHAMIEKSFADFGMSFDYYGRTSSPVHHETSQGFFRKLAEKDIFVLRKEKQLFDPEANLFLADRFIYGICPSCGYEKAYGDQCEKCGTSLSPQDLKYPKSALTDTKPLKKETTHWYLPLNTIQPKLEAWLKKHQNWKPNVMGQIKSWLTEGLKERAMTRDQPWGVKVPEDVATKAGVDAAGKVLYVWFDAPIGYISATREWAIQQGDPELWKKYWQDEDATLIHFIGKDNIVFHCLIFPAILMLHGDYVLPENVPANEFLNLEGNKFSTSRNYAVWLDEFLQKFDADSLRYTLTANLPEAKDADFSWKEFQARHNNELADILGNFINRTFTFIAKYFDGKLPERGDLDSLDKALIEQMQVARDGVGEAIDSFHFKEATKQFIDLARFANKYFNDQEPWATRKTDPQKCATTLHLCAQTAHALAILMSPFLPFTAEKMWRFLQRKGKAESANWDDIGSLSLETDLQFGKPEIPFKKIDDAQIVPEIEKLQKIAENMDKSKTEASSEKPEAQKKLISIQDFAQVDLRVAEVLTAEKLKGADKLLKLQVDTGGDKRQIIAGIAQHYQPEELIGKKIVIVANLQPAKLRGEISEGMLLAAETENGELSLVTLERGSMPGAKVK